MTQWKHLNSEFLPFHPQASHVNPDYRDGWNHCFRLAMATPDPIRAALELMLEACPDANDGRLNRSVLVTQRLVEACRAARAALAGAQKQE